MGIYPLLDGVTPTPVSFALASSRTGVDASLGGIPLSVGARAGDEGPAILGRTLREGNSYRVVFFVAGDVTQWGYFFTEGAANAPVERARGDAVSLWTGADLAPGASLTTHVPVADVVHEGSRSAAFRGHPFGIFGATEIQDSPAMRLGVEHAEGQRTCECYLWGPYGDAASPPGGYTFRASGVRASALGFPLAVLADVALPP